MLLLLSACARAASLPPLTRARAVTLVSRHGKTVYCEGTGLQNDGSEASLTDAPVALRPDTIFRIYSMSKPITSAALMTLYEEGKFQLSDPLWLHLGDAWKKDNMEVRHTAHVGRTRSVGWTLVWSLTAVLLLAGLRLRPPEGGPRARPFQDGALREDDDHRRRADALVRPQLRL